MCDLPARVRAALSAHEEIDVVRLIGSRRHGCASLLSDWDFEIETPTPKIVARDLPALAATLEPIVAQWDRLAYRACYMLLLSGPTKVDVMLDLDRPKEPPWTVTRETLPEIDDHFWDWILWLASKDEKGQIDKVKEQFALMQRHLLGPMGAPDTPTSVAKAIDVYLKVRTDRERAFGVRTRRLAEREVLAGLRRAGYGV